MARERDYAAEYARRQQRATAKGFESYAEQRRLRQVAAEAFPTTKTPAGVAIRDKAAALIKDGPGAHTVKEIQKAIGVKMQKTPQKKIIQLLRKISPKKARKG